MLNKLVFLVHVQGFPKFILSRPFNRSLIVMDALKDLF